jgi:RNA polymerase II C-terminal domain phosphatase-like 3/4
MMYIPTDHTLLHAVEQNPLDTDELEPGVHKIFVEGSTFLIKMRPGLTEFLEAMSNISQMYLYTNGKRSYAVAVATLFDPTGRFIGGRIVSRSDSPDFTLAKSLSKLFLGDTRMVLVIDDREDVWGERQARSLLLVRPFKFFREGQEANNASGPDSGFEIEEADAQLSHCRRSIERIHEDFYRHFDLHANEHTVDILSVRSILARIKKEILAGCVLHIEVASTDLISSSPALEMALLLGASVSQTMHEGVTHVLSLFPRRLIPNSHIFLVHPNWLRHCRWFLSRVDEAKYHMVAGDIDAILNYQEELSLLHPPGNTKSDNDDDDDDGFLLDIERELNSAE